jgi:hypothetical protein
MDFFQVNSGNFIVEINLKRIFSRDQLSEFSRQFRLLTGDDADFKALCTLKNGMLRYESETLLPLVGEGFKPKVLLVFGNPATHSVRNGMFFFSKNDEHHRHPMWGKLAKAGLVYGLKSKMSDSFTARQEEANLRKLMILSGTSAKKYLVGLTTFYSLPTPAYNHRYSGVTGVEKLFSPVLERIAAIEAKRILSYSFTEGAAIIFTQKSSHSRFCELTGLQPLYWPTRGKGAGGKDLADLLQKSSRSGRKQDTWSLQSIVDYLQNIIRE